MPRMNTWKDAEKYMLERDNEGPRRTKPADVGPASPKKIAKFYGEKERPYGDGLGINKEHQPPQFVEDQHDEKRGRYSNNVKDGWLRGSGLEGGCAKPGFDHGPVHGGPSPKGGKCTASGADMTASPFSQASKTYWGK